MVSQEIHERPGGSLYVGSIPRGCVLCEHGSKMVLFTTGLCDASCFYCPLSSEKAHRDIVFADEMPVDNDEDILYEAEAIGAEGAGLSGGDPLCVLSRTLHYIQLLKDHFGSDFHLHLYTAQSDASSKTIQSLADAGLDEIRFHPQGPDWSGIEAALRTNMTVGIEIPVLPDHDDSIKRTVVRADELGLAFVNLNELEASETNFQRLRSCGYHLRDMSSASIAGSAETAVRVLRWWSDHGGISLHYCSSRYKDTVQMRNRLCRRLQHTQREFEEADDDEPLLILGVVRAHHGERAELETLKRVYRVLAEEFEVPRELMNLDLQHERVEVAPWVLDEIADVLQERLPDARALEIGIAYEYPTWDRLQVRFDPL